MCGTGRIIVVARKCLGFRQENKKSSNGQTRTCMCDVNDRIFNPIIGFWVELWSKQQQKKTRQTAHFRRKLGWSPGRQSLFRNWPSKILIVSVFATKKKALGSYTRIFRKIHLERFLSSLRDRVGIWLMLVFNDRCSDFFISSNFQYDLSLLNESNNNLNSTEIILILILNLDKGYNIHRKDPKTSNVSGI